MSKEIMKETAHNASKDVASMKANNDAHRVREDLRAIKEDAANLVGHLKEEGAQQYYASKEKAKRVAEDYSEAGRERFQEVENYVRSNPAQSVAIAFVAGAIVSMLFGKR